MAKSVEYRGVQIQITSGTYDKLKEQFKDTEWGKEQVKVSYYRDSDGIRLYYNALPEEVKDAAYELLKAES